MPELLVNPYVPEDRARWDKFVCASKNGTFLIQRDFMEYHADRFTDASTLITSAGGRLLAVFPASRSGLTITSHAGLSYGGMICDSAMGASLAVDVFSAWLSFWGSHGATEVIYKSVPPIYHKMPADEDRYALFYHDAILYRRDVTSVVDLDAPGPIQERRRRGVKRAEKAGLRVSESSDFGAFWDVLSANLAERHGARPVHTSGEIALLRSRFPENIRMFSVYQGSTLCAGTVLFLCGPVVHAQYIASDEGARAQGALDLLFMNIIDRVRGHARYFDFGISNEREGRYLNRGLIEFKEGFGARAIVQDFFKIDLTEWLARGSQ